VRDPDRYLAQLFGLSEVLSTRHGWPALSPWWRETLTAAERSGTRQRVIRKGRRIGASTIIAPIVAVTEALHGEHDVPPNDVGYFLFFSVKKDEAAKRLRGIATVLDSIGVKYREAGDTIELIGKPLAFKVQAASYRTAVGDTSIGIWCDEVSRWLDAESGANPASEVLASVRPTLATMPNARIWLVSSPLGVTDAHAAAFDAGDTNAQRVYFCPTWVGNPSLTEAATHDLEPDERLWRREWAAIPQASLSSAFDPDAVARAFRTAPHAADSAQAICIVDASSGGGDAFTWAIARYEVPAVDHVERYLTELVHGWKNIKTAAATGTFPDFDNMVRVQVLDERGQLVENPEWRAANQPALVFHKIDAVEGRFAGSLAGSEIVRRIAADCRQWRVSVVLGDQREAFFLASEFQRHSLRFVPLTWTNANKIEAVTRLKRQFSENRLVLPPSREKLKKELLNYAERITQSGAITYSARGTGHDDEAALLITCAMGELERLVPGSPAYFPNHRVTVPGR
jgi:hypothetical protein